MSWSLVVAMCRREADMFGGAAVAAAVWDPVVRAAVLDRAECLRVPGLVLSRLLAEPACGVLPETAVRGFSERLGALRHAAAALDLERDRLLAVLQQRGVDLVLLKGAALRATLYAADPVQRQVGDLDVLVSPDDVEAAVSAAAEAGYVKPSDSVWQAYRRHHFHVQLRHPFGYVLEVHWALSEPHSLMGLAAAVVRQSAVFVARPAGPDFRMPRAEHMVLHLVQQIAQERCACFARLVDVDRLLTETPDLDWAFLARESRRAGLDTALALALDLARQMLGTRVPDGALRGRSRVALFHLRLLDPEARLLAPERPTRFTEDVLLDLWMVGGWSRRLQGAARLVSAEHAVDPLHRALGDLHARSAGARWLAISKIVAWQGLLYLRRSGAALRLGRRRA